LLTPRPHCAIPSPYTTLFRSAAELVVEALNSGTVPAPYAGKKGINGMPLESVIVDEAGGTTKQVTEYRNLAERAGVDAVIGYIRSEEHTSELQSREKLVCRLL